MKLVHHHSLLAFQVALGVRNPSFNAGDEMRVQSLVGEDPLEEGMAKLQYSYRKNLMNRRAWQAIVHRVKKRHD